MPFQQIRHRRISEEIMEQIKAQIRRGELQPGDRMLPEREVAQRLGVSRPAVREALAALEVMGLLESRPGEGVFVRPPELEKLAEHLAYFLALERQRVAEMYELRRALEVACAGQAARMASPGQLAAMERILQEMEADLRSNRLGEEADFRFHLAIAEGAQNQLMLRMMHAISDSLRQVLKSSREALYRIPGQPEQLLAEHRRIYDAIAAHNAEQAELMMRRHLDSVAALVLDRDRSEDRP